MSHNRSHWTSNSLDGPLLRRAVFTSIPSYALALFRPNTARYRVDLCMHGVPHALSRLPSLLHQDFAFAGFIVLKRGYLPGLSRSVGALPFQPRSGLPCWSSRGAVGI